MLKQPTMDWPAIVAELHRQGMTLGELAARNGLPIPSCRRVKTVTNYKAQDAIAEFLGRKPEDLWPSRYPKKKPRILDNVKYPPSERKKTATETDRARAA